MHINNMINKILYFQKKKFSVYFFIGKYGKITFFFFGPQINSFMSGLHKLCRKVDLEPDLRIHVPYETAGSEKVTFGLSHSS